MILKTPTEGEIKQVLFDPWIWDRETDDYFTDQSKFFVPEEATMLGGYVDGNIIGLFMTHPFRDGVKAHIAVLKFYRQQAREFAEKSLKTLKHKVYCQVAECYPEVVNFAKKHGFVELERGGSFMKNGHIHKRVTLCLL